MQAQPVLPCYIKLKGAQGSDIRVERVCEPQDNQETTSRTTTTQQVRDGAWKATLGEEGEHVGVRSQWLPGMTVSQPD